MMSKDDIIKNADTHSFMFIGAGDASYFEWAEVMVMFMEEPDKEQREIIEKNIPPPIEEDMFWLYRALHASSNEFAHARVAATYKKIDGEDRENWEEDEECFLASSTQLIAFVEDIENWLKEVHEISPILLSSVLLSYRREDCDSKETELFRHKWYMKKFNSILDSFEYVIEEDEYESIRNHMLENVFYIKEQRSKSDDKYIYFLYPGRIEVDAFLKGDCEPLKNVNKKSMAYAKIAGELLFEEIDTKSEKHKMILIENAKIIIGLRKIFTNITFEKICGQIWLSAFNENRQDVMEEVPKSKGLGDVVAAEAYNLLMGGGCVESRKLFKEALRIGARGLSLYCNALYVLQKDNTGLPVDRELNKEFLDICLPYAPENPAVFFNACCLYMEMDDYNEAYTMVKKAMEHEFYEKDEMKNQIKTEDFYKEFRENTDVLKLFKWDIMSLLKKALKIRFFSR